jgi:ketosteroid isomerase-like protein
MESAMKRMELPLALFSGRTLLIAGLACQFLASFPVGLRAQAGNNQDPAGRAQAREKRVHALEAELPTLGPVSFAPGVSGGAQMQPPSGTVAALQQQAPDDTDQTDVRGVINDFEIALHARSIEKIGSLVSPEIVVFENGYRNNGWPDFRDHHLVPEFKASTTRYRTEIVNVDASPSMAWGYSRMNRAYAKKNGNQPDVWTTYVLKKEAGKWRIIALNWSVRRLGE